MYRCRILWFVVVYFCLIAPASFADVNEGLVAYFPFNGNAVDASGNGHDGSPMGGVQYAVGIEGSALCLNGVDALVKVPHSEDLNLETAFTMACWIQSTGTNPNSGILTKMQSRAPRNGYLLNANRGGIADIQVNADKNWPSTFGRAFIEDGVIDGTWHHIVATYDGARLLIYRDGLVKMDVAYTNGLSANSQPLYIGWDPYYITSQRRYFKGMIDEVHIYNRALSLDEIETLYLGGSAQLFAFSDVLTNTLVVAGESTVQAITISNAGNAELEFSFCPQVEEVEDAGLVAYYPFNGNANDESGNGYDGAVNGATLTEDRFGNPDSAYHFDGQDDLVIVPDGVDFTVADVSVVAWIKTTDDSDMRHITSCYGTGMYSEWYNLYVRKDSGVASWQVDPGGIAGPPRSDSIISVCDGEWHCLVGVRETSSSLLKLYVDGILVSQNSDVSTKTLDPDVDFWIGGQNGKPTRYFNGKIDDVRVYNRALSDAEISDLYGEDDSTGCVFPDWLAVDPVSGTAAPGESVDISLTYNASNLVAGDYVEHILRLFSNDPEYPELEVPVSMWVVPSAPAMYAEPRCTQGKANEIAWMMQDGPLEYWVESGAVRHCSPAFTDPDYTSVPAGWSNANRFDQYPEEWSLWSGWIDSTSFLFDGLRLNTLYQYRVKASIMTEIGRLESDWSEWTASCQVPVIISHGEERVPGWWKRQHFGTEDNFIGSLDSDGDHLCDFDEYVAGGNPHDARSGFKIGKGRARRDGGFIVEWSSVEGRTYSVYWSPRVVGPYELLATDILYPQNSYTDTVHKANSGGFYRIDVQLQEY